MPITVTVTPGGSGNFKAVASLNVDSPIDAMLVSVVNNAGVPVYMAQMSFITDVTLPPSQLTPVYAVFPIEVPAPQQTGQGYPIPYNFRSKSYLTFLSTAPDRSALPGVFAGAPQDDSLFVAPPQGPSQFVPLRLAGCIEAVLSPQTDTTPPHNVHPAVAVTSTPAEYPLNPVLGITNNSGSDVTLYVQIFYNNGNASDFYAYPLNSRVCTYAFPTAHGNPAFLKAWYGFAFTGQYASAQDYFQAHPKGQAHHTGEVPPADSDSGREGGDGTGN